MIKKQVRVSDINKYPYFEWASEKGYLEGDNVIYDNKTYECTTSHMGSDGFDLDLKNW